MRTWTYQNTGQVKKHGAENASWYAGWYDPTGKRRCKSCGKGAAGRRDAKRLAEKIAAQMVTGTYEDRKARKWEDFIADYTEQVLSTMKAGSRSARETTLKHFRRLSRPILTKAVDTKMLDKYIAARKVDRPGIAPATINHELRELRATIRKAVQWGELERVPNFNFQREPAKLITYISQEDFAKLYLAADKMTEPGELRFSPADWWRGLIVMGIMCGWRIGSLLSLRWADVSLDNATALSRATDNKGNRDLLVSLPQVVVTHLRKLESFGPAKVFPCAYRRGLYDAWHDLQTSAGVQREDGKPFGFHDLRRGFATMNHDRLSPEVLQQLMAHRDPSTTKRYIRLAEQLKPAVHDVFTPSCLVSA